MSDTTDAPVLDDLDKELAAAMAASSAAALTPEEAERERKLAALEDAKATRRKAEAARRKIAGDRLEREARAEAGGKYLVKYFDLGAKFPDDCDKIPGGGILVLRSHPPEAKRAWDREVEASGAASKDMSEINAELVCASIVRPKLSDADGIRFRAWLDSEMGCGVANILATPALELGGARAAETKRGRA